MSPVLLAAGMAWPPAWHAMAAIMAATMACSNHSK
jgi:hypothetical protein